MALILYICLHRRAHFLLENPVNSLVGPSKGLIHLYIKFTIHSTIVHFCCNTWDIPSPSSSTTLDVERLVWGQHMAWNVWGSYMETSTSCFLQPVCGEVVQDSVWKRTPITIFKMFCGIRMHYYINIAINIPVSCARKGSPLKSIYGSYDACFECSICHPTGSWIEASFHQALPQRNIAMLASGDFREMERPLRKQEFIQKPLGERCLI